MRYNVFLEITVSTSVAVEAQTEGEARERAEEAARHDTYRFTGYSVDYVHVMDITEEDE